MSMHAPDMVFENHTAGESAEGEDGARHIASIFDSWPDIAFSDAPAVRPRRARRAGMDRDAPPTARRCAAATSSPSRAASAIEWKGLDVIPFEDGLLKRKDVYSDSVSILRQVGLLELAAR